MRCASSRRSPRGGGDRGRDPRGGHASLGRRGRRGDHRQGALRADPLSARRCRADAGRRPAHPRRHARRRDRDPGVQRPAARPAAAPGAGRELAVSPRPRHRSRVGARGDAARLAALGRAAGDARLRGLLRRWRGGSPARPTSRTTRGSGGSCVPIRGWARSRSGRSTRRPGSRTLAALVALVHCLARDAAEAGAGRADPPPEVVEEGMFRAARFGVHGELPDAGGTL